MMTVFLSCGPAMVTPKIIKPVMIVPGVKIMTTWTDEVRSMDLACLHLKSPPILVEVLYPSF